MVVPVRKAVSGVNTNDSLFCLGSSAARIEGLVFDNKSGNKLSDLIPETSVCHFHYLWDSDGVKVVAVSTSVDSTPKTWYYEESQDMWLETDPVIKATAIFATSMAEKNVRLTKENELLRQELATTRLDNELLRHDLVRAREQIPKKKTRFGFTLLQRVLIGLILGLIFASLIPTGAAEVTFTTHEQLKTTTTKTWQKEVLEKCQNVIRDCSEKFLRFLENEWFQLLITLWSHWIVHLIVFIVIGWFRYENCTPTLVLAFLAMWSNWKFNAFLPLSAIDVGGMLAHCATMFLYPINDRLAFVVMCSIVVGNMFYCILIGENPYWAVSSGITVTAVFCTNILCDHLCLPKGLPSLAFVLYRVFYYVAFKPATVVVKDSDGKVIETTNVVPGKSGFQLWSRFKQMLQKRTKPRTTVEPFFSISPNSTVLVKTPEGTGTGFRVANWLVTAKHVLGSLDVCEIVHEGKSHASRVKWRHPNKDIVYLMLPPGLQDLKAYKINKQWEDGPLAIVTKSGDHVSFAVAYGVQVGDEVTYAVQTPDGSSGAPVIVPCGRAAGVHVVNTGFSAGCVIITPDDMPPNEDAKSQEIERLRKELESLKAQGDLKQCATDAQDIVNLVREAVKREFTILRKELAVPSDDSDSDEENDFFEQKKKGKNKKNRRRGGRGNGPNRNKRKKPPVWTEQEYQEMQDKGFTRERLMEMADEIRERMQVQAEQEAIERAIEDPYEYNPYGAYPDEDDYQNDEEEINEIWFKQHLTKDSKASRFSQIWYNEFQPPSPKIHPEHVAVKFFTDCKEEILKRMSRRALNLKRHIEDMIKFAINANQWNEEIDKDLLLDKLCEMYYDLNEEMFLTDLPLFFCQKNSKGGPNPSKRPPKSTN
nr:MAG: ORF1a protein [Wenzhou bat astrovirus 3]